MSAPHESQAVTVARAHVEAWGNHDYDTARSILAPDGHVTVPVSTASGGGCTRMSPTVRSASSETLAALS